MEVFDEEEGDKNNPNKDPENDLAGGSSGVEAASEVDGYDQADYQTEEDWVAKRVELLCLC